MLLAGKCPHLRVRSSTDVASSLYRDFQAGPVPSTQTAQVIPSVFSCPGKFVPLATLIQVSKKAAIVEVKVPKAKSHAKVLAPT